MGCEFSSFFFSSTGLVSVHFTARFQNAVVKVLWLVGVDIVSGSTDRLQASIRQKEEGGG